MEMEFALAIVTNVDDPAKGGAIKISLPDISGDEYPEWVEPVFPAPMVAVPEVKDTVLVIMPAGDDITEFPEEVRYLGRLITEGEGVPDEFKTHYPKRRGVKTKAGHYLYFDDEDGSIVVQSGAADASITMNPAGDVTIKGVTKVHLSSPTTDLNGTPTDFLLKGTKFFADFVTAFLATWQTTITDVSIPPVDPNWTAYKTAMGTLIGALITAAAGWVSTTTRTS